MTMEAQGRQKKMQSLPGHWAIGPMGQWANGTTEVIIKTLAYWILYDGGIYTFKATRLNTDSLI